ncbi:MAG: valine--tRNA ligase [Bdellovibrio sp.]|nr:MAG: valine--tRNA ligase [Bdellovibrio sp.]
MELLSDRYNHQEAEARNYRWWEEQGFFKADDRSTKPPYCIILPPPNVTGSLHLGHALDQSIQDCLIRWKRMNGFNTLWQPGTDHAGISTQTVVEKELKKEKLTRQGIGREKFLQRTWEWKRLNGDRITLQMRRLGASCDWDRAVFTLDDRVSAAVRKVFVSLFRKGWIYRGQRLVNWSGPLQTAISDLEVEYKQVKGSLWHIRYPLENGRGHLIVATTRPETLLGDTAVCVHPQDERYKQWVGQNVILPLLTKSVPSAPPQKRKIPIIADSYVDMKFGSGVVKITPAHDFNDYKIGKKHNLPFINILDTNTFLNEHAGPYAGLSVTEARKKVLEDLKAQDLLEKEEPHVLNVGHCSRSGAVVEPFLSEQWFVKMDQLAVPAQRVVESGTINIDPESWTKVYLHWMSIIEDWCISRQLWWGHRIPAWYCKDCQQITVAEKDPTSCEHCGSGNLTQDEDVLDTWFSSALWPFSTLGWPEETEALKTFYPTNVLVTGNDILFFWVARMVMMGLEFKRDVPFRQVLLHGMIRDSQGRKMSKSLGNGIDPLDLIEKYGADALRLTFLAHVHAGKDYKFSEQRLEGYRNFMNKIWNATRFALNALQDFQVPEAGVQALPNRAQISSYDQWIIYRLAQAEDRVEEALEEFRFADAAGELYSFVWYEFCDWYIEFSKSVFSSPPSEERSASQLTMAQVLNRIVRLLHPFVPFITEEIYSKLPIKNKACIVDEYPNIRTDRAFLALGQEAAAVEVDLVKGIVSAIRNIRGENRIPPAARINVRIVPSDEHAQKIIGEHRAVMMALGRVDTFEIGEDEGSLSKCALSLVNVQVGAFGTSTVGDGGQVAAGGISGQSSVRVIVPLQGLVDIDEEIKRIHKTIEKLDKDIAILVGRLSNENFVKNAAEEIVHGDRQQLEQAKKQVQDLRESLTRLQS